MKKWVVSGLALLASLVIILNTALNAPSVHAPVAIDASVDVSPAILKLGAPEKWQEFHKWITCYIELPEGYDPSDIDVSSILLNGVLEVDPAAPTSIGDHNGNGVPDLMVKFKRGGTFSVTDFGGHAFFTRGHDFRYCYPAVLAITGQLLGGANFSGEGSLGVVWPNHVLPK